MDHQPFRPEGLAEQQIALLAADGDDHDVDRGARLGRSDVDLLRSRVTFIRSTRPNPSLTTVSKVPRSGCMKSE